MSTTNQQRRARKKQHRHSQRVMGERVADLAFVETLTADFAQRGTVSAAGVKRARSVEGLDELFAELRARQWGQARERGWDEELVRRGLRKLDPGLARGLFEGGPLDLFDNLVLSAWLLRLPRLPQVTKRADAGNARMVEKVRALLAKAESTEFPEEAEAFTMKAQQLITEHCLQDALAASAPGDGPGLTRIVADDPYAEAKFLLIATVAAANRCRAVWTDAFGFATIVGYPADLDAVELIFTSLLVQATRSMTVAGEDHAQKRSPSFRRSFLIAFAGRVGERLKEAERSVLDPIADDRLLPVLAARDSRVEEALGEIFPNLVEKPYSVTNGHGWAAGRSAADHARLSPREQVYGTG